MKNWCQFVFYCQICLLPHHINYKFMCLCTYWQWKSANEGTRIFAVTKKSNWLSRESCYEYLLIDHLQNVHAILSKKIIQESPGYRLNLALSCTSLQISQTKQMKAQKCIFLTYFVWLFVYWGNFLIFDEFFEDLIWGSLLWTTF